MSKTRFSTGTIGPRIYLGPNIRGTALTHNMIFKEELPDFAAALVEKCPEIKRLLVPIEELTAAQNNLNTKGSLMAQMYKIVEAKFAEGGEN